MTCVYHPSNSRAYGVQIVFLKHVEKSRTEGNASRYRDVSTSRYLEAFPSVRDFSTSILFTHYYDKQDI